MTAEFERYEQAVQENIKLRAQLLVKAESDPAIQAAIIKLCTYGSPGIPGYLWFFRLLAFVYEPRNLESKALPFYPFPFQEEELEVLDKAITDGQGVTGKRTNIVYLKSRDMGMTWIILVYFLWRWMFHNASFLVGHKKQEDVDKRGDMKTLFEKMRWELKCMPAWLLEYIGFRFKDHDRELLLRKDNPSGGEISGESSNPDFGRGDRRSAILYDELQSWPFAHSSWKAGAGSSNVRLAVGTPKGNFGKYAQLARGKAEKAILRKIHWTRHPLKAKGLTIVDGKPTSPWYEGEKESLSANDVASELDLDFNESTEAKVFGGYGEGHKRSSLLWTPQYPVLCILDPGLTFFALWLQVDHWKRVKVLTEYQWTSAKIRDVGEKILEINEMYFKNAKVEYCGDPAGSWLGNSGQEDPEYVTLADDYKIQVDWSWLSAIPTQKREKKRIKAVENLLGKYIGEGAKEDQGPALLINTEECPILDEALSGGYRWKIDPRTKQPLEITEREHPFEDAADCLGMGVLYKMPYLGKLRDERDPDDEEAKEDSQEETDYKWVHGSRRC